MTSTRYRIWYESNDGHYSYASTKAGETSLKENENPMDKARLEIIKDKRKLAEESAISDVEEIVSGPSKINVKPKARKWKLKARIPIAKRAKDHGLIGAKRPSNDDNQLSPQHKKKKKSAQSTKTTTHGKPHKFSNKLRLQQPH